jgi:hypothetical protein
MIESKEKLSPFQVYDLEGSIQRILSNMKEKTRIFKMYTCKDGAIQAHLALTKTMCEYLGNSKEDIDTKLAEEKLILESTMENGLYLISSEIGDDYIKKLVNMEDKVIITNGEPIKVNGTKPVDYPMYDNAIAITKHNLETYMKEHAGLLEQITGGKDVDFKSLNCEELENFVNELLTKPQKIASPTGNVQEVVLEESWQPKEDTKYYTPTIEEFHVGFEYERCYEISSTNGEKYWLIENWDNEECLPKLVDQGYWEKKVFDTTDSVDINIPHDYFINYENNKQFFRVKYLDKEDIESLGWKNVEDRGMSENYGYSFIKPIQYLSGGNVDYKLRYWFTNHRVRIETLSSTIFDGTIKNKSELKVLLKQLGIDD